MFGWFKSRKALLTELDDERATIVVVECAVRPECAETIKKLRAENDWLRSTYIGNDK